MESSKELEITDDEISNALEVNQIFSTFDKAKQLIDEYARKIGFIFIKAHTQAGEKKSDDFPYASISFTCEKYGKPRFRGTGTRQTKSKKCDCKVSIRLTLSENQYKITYVHLEHNHDLIQDSNSNVISERKETLNSEYNKKKVLMPSVEKEAETEIQDNMTRVDGTPLNRSSVLGFQYIDQPLNSNSKLKTNEYLEESSNQDIVSVLVKQCENIIDKLHTIQKDRGLLDIEPLQKLQDNLSRLIDFNVSKLSKIKLVETKSRGRPKGTELTAIGLKAKKINKQFERRTSGQQLMGILDWFVLANAIKSNVIDKEYKIRIDCMQIKQKPKLIQHFLDLPCNLNLLKHYMEEDAYDYFVKIVEETKKKEGYECGICSLILYDDCIQCQSCLLWYEYACAGIQEEPSDPAWFCQQCTQMFSANSDKYK